MTSKLVSDLITKSLRSFDAEEAAESILGHSARDTERGKLLMVSLACENRNLLLQNLKERGDSFYGISFASFLALAESMGFEEVLRTIVTVQGSEGPREELHFIAADPVNGIVLNTTSHYSRVNAASVWYAWKPHRITTSYLSHESLPFLGSGGFESLSMPDWSRLLPSGQFPSDLLWFGHHDVREGFRFSIEQAKERGSFLPSWPANLRSSLVHMFVNSYDFRAFDDQVVSYGVLAEHVRSKALNRYIDCPQWFKDILNRSVV